MKGQEVLFSSKKDEWLTPECVLERVRKLGPIDLDPCTTPENPVGAYEFYTAVDDGLDFDWHHERVFINPPYSRVALWVERAWQEHCYWSNEIVCLTPARTDTRWWHSFVKDCADAVCFWKGRLKFSGHKNSAPFPSAVVYYGHRPGVFKEAFEDKGWVVFV